MDESGFVCSCCDHCADHHFRVETVKDERATGEKAPRDSEPRVLGKCTEEGCTCTGGPTFVAI
jgi:hypothetical protein